MVRRGTRVAPRPAAELQHALASARGAGRACWIEDDLLAGAQRAVEMDGPFDLVLICLVLEHIEDVVPAVVKAGAVLADAGRLLIIEMHPALHERGIGANFRLGDREIRLPSFRHTAAELVQAIDHTGLSVLETRDHFPSEPALKSSPKLSRFTGSPVLLEVAAQRGALAL